MLACFVGVVATTLSFASLGLVAVASGAGTSAAAGMLLPCAAFPMQPCVLMTCVSQSAVPLHAIWFVFFVHAAFQHSALCVHCDTLHCFVTASHICGIAEFNLQ